MRRDVLELDTALSRVVRETRLSLAEVEAIRLLLAGGSVVDWIQLAFRRIEEVDRFLARQLISTSDPIDADRLRYVYNEAVSYLEEYLHTRFPPELRDPEDVREVFLVASRVPGGLKMRRKQLQACMVLKLMHVIHHMEAADLRFQTAISEAQLLELAYRRIMEGGREMRAAGLPVVSFYGSRKTRTSVITKLLVKRENIAATVFDKLRFRIVVEEQTDLIPATQWLVNNLFPFNYVIPGQSHNNLIRPEDLVRFLHDPDMAQVDVPQHLPGHTESGKNEFSGATYRAFNFIVDFPIRIPDSYLSGTSLEMGRVVFVMVEFQLVDAWTARRNEAGENAHHEYKRRQRQVVNKRLMRGTVPKD
ncbi:MAG: TIGR04552 family protein [Deltaproteobacteria bacterium]|nr:TIGR04552 family protein [Deltaproteobacteria bacterium]